MWALRSPCNHVSGVNHCDTSESRRLQHVELVLAYQTYGLAKKQEQTNDLESLLLEYKQYPILIAHDYDQDGSNDTIKSRIKDHLGLGRDKEVPFKRASCVTRVQFTSSGDNLRPELKVVAVMPRQYPLLLGHPKQGGCGKPTQGKAANQLNALRVASGHVLQVLDANMDFVMLEGLKVPAVLSLFYSADDRSESNYHIVGFQEHVYTGELSSVGQVMANTEYAFGTIFQHTLANDLGVRLHYGHPDFVDTFWVLNNGGMSKASPDINLSEDAVSVQSVPNSCCQDL